MEMTVEQKRALALASARLRLQDQNPDSGSPQTQPQPRGERFSTAANIIGGAVEPNLTLLTGAVSGPLSGYAGMLGTVLPGPEGQGARWTENVQNAITYKPITEGGKAAQSVIGYPFEKIAEVSDWAGQKTADITGSPLIGALQNARMQVGIPLAIGASIKTTPAANTVQGYVARWLMQKAVKPDVKDLAKGNAQRALQTMLDEGINPTPGGMAKAQGIISALNDQVESGIKSSSGRVNLNEVGKRVDPLVDKAITQVAWEKDLGAISAILDEFNRNPKFAQYAKEVPEAQALVKRLEMARNSALQDAGRFQTFAAQQEGLAHGGSINLAQQQPRNAPYFNVGASGDVAISPSAFPVSGYPRVPGRYTENIQRVPEGVSAAQDALAIYNQRRAELANARAALDDAQGRAGTIPVQLAHEIKKGTYQSLGEKNYGEVGSASSEAQKALARGLREEILSQVPEVAPLLKREGALLNILDTVENKALIGGNKNPQGLAALRTDSPLSWGNFMFDRSALAKSALARAIYSTGNPELVRALIGISAQQEGVPKQ